MHIHELPVRPLTPKELTARQKERAAQAQAKQAHHELFDLRRRISSLESQVKSLGVLLEPLLKDWNQRTRAGILKAK